MTPSAEPDGRNISPFDGPGISFLSEEFQGRRVGFACEAHRPTRPKSLGPGGHGAPSARAFAHATVAYGKRALQLEALSYLRYIAKMRWTVESLNAAVDAEIDALPRDMRARLARLSGIIEEHGLGGLPRDAVKHLEGRLWELRITGRDGISRAIYLTAAVRRVVIVRVFVKKTQKTPPRELELARQRAKEVP